MITCLVATEPSNPESTPRKRTLPAAQSITSVRSKRVTPSASTTSARPRTSFAGCSLAQAGSNIAPGSSPSRPVAPNREPTVRWSQYSGRSTPNRRSSATSALANSRCTALRANTTVPPRSKSQSMPSSRATRPTSSTVSTIACRIATAASKPCWRSSDPGERGNSAEHQPPLRPDAPKPAISRSSTAIRSWGSAFASEYAVHSPVSPPPTMQTSNRASAASGSRGASSSRPVRTRSSSQKLERR